VDRQLIRDKTYFVAEKDGVIIACGGWSKRESLFGSDAARAAEDALLDPLQDAARIRAARFRSIELVATLPGVPFYRAFDYEAGERYEVPLVNGLSLPVVRMSKNLVSPNQ
jgi:hypothetical protein